MDINLYKTDSNANKVCYISSNVCPHWTTLCSQYSQDFGIKQLDDVTTWWLLIGYLVPCQHAIAHKARKGICSLLLVIMIDR